MVIVQYIVLNWDVVSNWSRGATIAQACHASCAAILKYLEREDTKYYTAAENLGSMTKVILKASDDEFRSLRQVLRDSSIEMHCWTEQPEGIETCLALRPYEKDRVHGFVSRLHLLR